MSTQDICDILIRAAQIAVAAGNNVKALDLVAKIEQIITPLYSQGKIDDN